MPGIPSLFILVLFTIALFWKKRTKPINSNLRHIQTLTFKGQTPPHRIATILSELIDKDGAGAWPPKANHTSWPMALRPYKEIYLKLAPTLSVAEPSLDDNFNHDRRIKYRSAMRKLLNKEIDMGAVKALMTATEAEQWDVFTRDAYNGFYCCIAVCRHAYRWATIPVVKVAQTEKTVEFPPELDLPWPYLQRRFGVTADSGNNTANVLHNFDENGERIYKINVGMSKIITSSEDAFFRMFYDLEILALPIYDDMVHSIVAFEENDKVSCVNYLQSISFRLRHLLKVFYDGLVASRVSHSVWLSYVQGFQGWGVGRMINGELVKYDGLSGNHVLFFQALDAFLGMERYLSDENMIRYIPVRQRDLCIALKEHSFRHKITAPVDLQLENELKRIVNHMKVRSASFRTRVMPYLEQPAPERLIMTAGKSVLENSSTKSTKEALKGLDEMLVNRLRETI